MDKSNILLRLEMLANLCEATEPEVPNDKQLFSNHLIEVQNMITLVTDMESGEVNFESGTESQETNFPLFLKFHHLWIETSCCCFIIPWQ